jgi:hypothetical protein
MIEVPERVMVFVLWTSLVLVAMGVVVILMVAM